MLEGIGASSFPSVLGSKLRALHTLGKLSTDELRFLIESTC